MTSSPPDRTLHCYRHDQAYVGQCEKCAMEMYRQQGQGLAGRSMRGYQQAEKPKLTTEQVIAELKEIRAKGELAWQMARVMGLIDQLPRVDVVEECIRAGWRAARAQPDEIDCDRLAYMRGALRKAREIWGLPADPDLEGK